MHPQMSNDDAHKLFGDKVQVEILSISNDVIGYNSKWQNIQEANTLEQQLAELSTNNHHI